MYASRSDLEIAFGRETVDRWAIREEDPLGDAAVAQAIAHATALIDAHISVRFPLPLPETPKVLADVACELTAARLATTADQMTDEMRRREKQARHDLREIAEGRMNLGLPTPAGQTGVRPRPIFGMGGSKLFSRDSLRAL